MILLLFNGNQANVIIVLYGHQNNFLLIQKNFQERQTITITRVKNSPKTTLIPVLNGGGFNLVSADIFPIYIQESFHFSF